MDTVFPVDGVGFVDPYGMLKKALLYSFAAPTVPAAVLPAPAEAPATNAEARAANAEA
jgi:hypothetical protein